MQKLCESIESDPDFLQKRPVLVNLVEGAYIVYAGNQRVRAAKKLGWKEIPCIIDEGMDEATIKSRTIKDNHSLGDWDYDILANEYDLSDLIEWGFDMKDFDLDGSSEDIELEEKKKKETICPHCGEVIDAA